MYVSRTTRGVTRYQCQSKSKTSEYDCRYHSISADTIDEIVWTRIVGTMMNRERMQRELERLRTTDPTDDEIAALDRTLGNLRTQAANVETANRNQDGEERIGHWIADGHARRDREPHRNARARPGEAREAA